MATENRFIGNELVPIPSHRTVELSRLIPKEGSLKISNDQDGTPSIAEVQTKKSSLIDWDRFRRLHFIANFESWLRGRYPEKDFPCPEDLVDVYRIIVDKNKVRRILKTRITKDEADRLTKEFGLE